MVSGIKISRRGEVDLSGLMAAFMMAHTRMARGTGAVRFSGLMAATMRVSGAITRCMGMENSGGRMVAYIMATTIVTRSTVTVFTRGPTAADTRASSTKVASMEKASIGSQMERNSTGFGIWARRSRCLRMNRHSWMTNPWKLQTR